MKSLWLWTLGPAKWQSSQVPTLDCGPGAHLNRYNQAQNMHTWIYVFYIHSYTHRCVHAYMQACMHACVHAYIHTYIHTYIHKHLYYICTYVYNIYIYICTYLYMHMARGSSYGTIILLALHPHLGGRQGISGTPANARLMEPRRQFRSQKPKPMYLSLRLLMALSRSYF